VPVDSASVILNIYPQRTALPCVSELPLVDTASLLAGRVHSPFRNNEEYHDQWVRVKITTRLSKSHLALLIKSSRGSAGDVLSGLWAGDVMD